MSSTKQYNISIIAGNGLTGGGDLSASRTIDVNFGSLNGSVCRGDDERILSISQKIDLTDGTDSDLHYHSSDRKWSNLVGIPVAFTPTTGITNNVACAGDDPRLTDSRIPISHESEFTTFGIASDSLYGHVKCLGGSAASLDHIHNYDNYLGWNYEALDINGVSIGNSDITASSTARIKAGKNVYLDWESNTIIINANDTNSWRPITDTPTEDNIGTSISASWAYKHSHSIIISTNSSIIAGNTYIVNGGITLTLPRTQVIGDIFILIPGTDWSISNLNIFPNGSKVFGIDGSFKLYNSRAYIFSYKDIETGWVFG